MFGNFDPKMLQNITPPGPTPSSPGYDPAMSSFGGPMMSQQMRNMGSLPIPGIGDPMQQYDTMMMAQNLYNGGGMGWQDALQQSMGAFGFMPQQASAPPANPGPPPGTSPKPPPGTVPPGTAPPGNSNPATQEPPPWLLPYSQTPNPFAGGL